MPSQGFTAHHVQEPCLLWGLTPVPLFSLSPFDALSPWKVDALFLFWAWQLYLAPYAQITLLHFSHSCRMYHCPVTTMCSGEKHIHGAPCFGLP